MNGALDNIEQELEERLANFARKASCWKHNDLNNALAMISR